MAVLIRRRFCNIFGVSNQFQKYCTQKSETSENLNESNEDLTDIKKKILAASVPFVIEHNWSKEAIALGAEQIGYPGTVHGLFPRGGAELVQYFYTDCNEKLVDHLKNKYEEIKLKKGQEIIEHAIEVRLKMLIPYLSRWPSALAIMTLPPNVPSALANLLTLADDICYYAGDRSVDTSWYIRRIGVAGIYKMTELYMLQDKSDNFKDTFQFLNNRVNEGNILNSVYEKTELNSQYAMDSLKSAIILARNILGLTR